MIVIGIRAFAPSAKGVEAPEAAVAVAAGAATVVEFEFDVGPGLRPGPAAGGREVGVGVGEDRADPRIACDNQVRVTRGSVGAVHHLPLQRPRGRLLVIQTTEIVGVNPARGARRRA